MNRLWEPEHDIDNLVMYDPDCGDWLEAGEYEQEGTRATVGTEHGAPGEHETLHESDYRQNRSVELTRCEN